MYPDFANLLRLERLVKQIGLSAIEFAELIKGRVVNFTGRLLPMIQRTIRQTQTINPTTYSAKEKQRYESVDTIKVANMY